jgi:integrase
MSIFNKTTSFVDNINKRFTDVKKASVIKDYILKLDCADNTKAGLITKVKNYIKDNKIFKNEDNIKLLNAPEIYNKIFEKVNKDRDDKKPVDIDIENVEKIFNFKYAKKLNDKGENEIDFYAIYCYLLVTSGMRTNEIWDNDFEIIDKDKIKPKRISKSYNSNAPDDSSVYLLIPAKEWLSVFKELQNYILIHNPKYGSTIFTGIKRKLEKINPDMSGHSLRKLYLAYHKQILKTYNDKLPSVGTAKLLNHNGEGASTFYTGSVNITGELKDVIDRVDYNKMKVVEIKEVLKSKNITFKAKAKKADLVKLLNF